MVSLMVGDIVKLKSGGPLMTVIEAGDGQWVTCIWFDGDGKHNTHTFPLEALLPVQG